MAFFFSPDTAGNSRRTPGNTRGLSLHQTVYGKIVRVKRPDFLAKGAVSLAKVPLKAWIMGGVLFILVALYSVVFFIQKPVEFSYANTTCVRQLLLAPDLQKTNSPDFAVTVKDKTTVGPVTLLSTSLCFEPITAPKEGSHVVAFAPFGGPIAAKQFKIEVAQAPVARKTDFINKTIPTARPLQIALSTPDQLHKYSLKIGEKTTSCPQNNNQLVCDITSLDLAQGAEYSVALQKKFKDETP